MLRHYVVVRIELVKFYEIAAMRQLLLAGQVEVPYHLHEVGWSRLAFLVG